jgi:hypothetical protein
LPTGSTRCLREDPKNQNLLIAGTEFGVWASIDRGAHWNRLNNNLPTVAVHEIAIHPTAGEMVVATHGRSLWITDITPLRQMTAEVIRAAAHLYEPNTTIRWRTEPAVGAGGGAQRFRGENPPRAAQIFYSLTKKPQKIALTIVDVSGNTVRELQVKDEPGLNQVTWDLTRSIPRRGGRRDSGSSNLDQGRGGRRGRGRSTDSQRAGQPDDSQAEPAATPPQAETPLGEAAQTGEANQPQSGQRREPGQPARGGAGQQQRQRSGPPAPAGTYRIVLTVDGREYSQIVRVETDPTLPSDVAAAAAEASAIEEAERPAEDPGRAKAEREIGTGFIDN